MNKEINLFTSRNNPIENWVYVFENQTTVRKAINKFVFLKKFGHTINFYKQITNLLRK